MIINWTSSIDSDIEDDIWIITPKRTHINTLMTKMSSIEVSIDNCDGLSRHD